MVIRPKSIATVVVVLASPAATSSVSSPTELSTSSVCSGRISLTAPTRVVLPTPKPPAIRILIAVGTARARPSVVAEPMDHRLENVVVGRGRGLDHGDRTRFEKIGQQDAHH